jgi:hypothetical protein
MSLIQEALKRQQAETEGTLPPETSTPTPAVITPAEIPNYPITPTVEEIAPPPPSESEPLPVSKPETPVQTQPAKHSKPPDAPASESKVAATVESEPKPKSALPSILGVILLVLLLIGAIMWAIMYGLNMVSTNPKQVTTDPANSSVKYIDPATTPIDTEPEPVGPTTAETGPDASDPKESSNPAPTEAPETVKAAGTEAPPETPTKEAPPIAELVVHTPQPKVQWPAVKLSGVMGGGQRGSAIINGKVIGINESVDGIRVLKIEPKGVMLEYQQEQRFLKVGKTLE